MKTFSSLSYTEKERICESIFLQEGPFWHLFTDGTRMQNIFTCEDDFETGMNILAVLSCGYTDIKIVAFEFMSNHLHWILAGKREICLEMFEEYKIRLRRVFRKMGKILDWSQFQADIIPIDNLKSLRNEVIYAHRNAFVAQAEYTPYNYPWGSGIAYFNPTFKSLPVENFDSIAYDRRRSLAHRREIEGLSKLKFFRNRVFIPSFCDVELGESLYCDARSYFSSLTRNAETFSEIASRLKDVIFLTDDELYAAAVKYCTDEYNIKQLAVLSPEQKLTTAKELHFRYNATKQQLRRMLKLDLNVLDQLFPDSLSGKHP